MPKIKGKDHLIKDEYSQAVINTDRDAYTLYKKRKIIMQSKNKEIETLKWGIGPSKETDKSFPKCWILMS